MKAAGENGSLSVDDSATNRRRRISSLDDEKAVRKPRVLRAGKAGKEKRRRSLFFPSLLARCAVESLTFEEKLLDTQQPAHIQQLQHQLLSSIKLNDDVSSRPLIRVTRSRPGSAFFLYTLLASTFFRRLHPLAVFFSVNKPEHTAYLLHSVSIYTYIYIFLLSSLLLFLRVSLFKRRELRAYIGGIERREKKKRRQSLSINIRGRDYGSRG